MACSNGSISRNGSLVWSAEIAARGFGLDVQRFEQQGLDLALGQASGRERLRLHRQPPRGLFLARVFLLAFFSKDVLEFLQCGRLIVPRLRERQLVNAVQSARRAGRLLPARARQCWSPWATDRRESRETLFLRMNKMGELHVVNRLKKGTSSPVGGKSEGPAAEPIHPVVWPIWRMIPTPSVGASNSQLPWRPTPDGITLAWRTLPWTESADFRNRPAMQVVVTAVGPDHADWPIRSSTA